MWETVKGRVIFLLTLKNHKETHDYGKNIRIGFRNK